MAASTKDWGLSILLWVAGLLVVVELITLLVFATENSDLRKELRFYQERFSRTESDVERLSKHLIQSGWRPPPGWPEKQSSAKQ